MSPFDYVNDILVGKKNIMVDEETEKAYNPYLVNKALSYHKDCLHYANEMNSMSFLDNKLQFEYLINTIRSKKRNHQKWFKVEKNEDINSVKLYYGVSEMKAREYLKLLSEDQIKIIREKTDIGGLGVIK